MKKRNTSFLVWPDVIRVLAIVGVVCIHSLTLPPVQTVTRSWEDFVTWAIFITAKSAVPLFLMLSGALLLDKTESYQQFIFKRVHRIIWPWLAWSFIFLIAKHVAEITSIWAGLRTFISVMSAEFSFLPVLFCLYVLLPFFRVWVKHFSDRQRWLLISIWFMSVSVLPFLRNSLAFPAVVDNGLVTQTVQYFGYLFLGLEIKKMKFDSKHKNNTLFASALLFIFSVGVTLFLLYSHPEPPLLFLSYVAPNIVISSTLAFFLLCHFGRNINLPGIRQLSSASFGVFFCHSLVISFFKMVSIPEIHQNSMFWNLYLSTATVIGSFSVIWYLNTLGTYFKNCLVSNKMFE